MKLIMESWKKYLKEDQEEVEEGLASKLALGAGLVGALGGSAEAGVGDRIKDLLKNRAPEAAQQQQAPEEGPSEDGKSFTAKAKLAQDMQAAMDSASLSARTGLMDQGHAQTDIDAAVKYDQVGGYLYATVTLK
jgi:hypothetical protein